MTRHRGHGHLDRKVLLALFSGLLILVILASDAVTRADERFDRLPKQYQKWLEEEVVYIITRRERDAFLDLQAVEEWEAFIDAFWRRRDPDVLTPVNEFKDEHYQRIEHANRQMGRESAVPGWMTDRGKMYIILGKPDDISSFPSVTGVYPSEVWFYQANPQKNLPPLYLLFFQEGHAGPFRLYNHLLDNPQDLLPAKTFDLETARAEAYDALKDVSPDLAHASLTMRADEGPLANLYQPERAGLDFQVLLSEITQSPFRRVDTSYVDAAREARGLVESEYLFNYVPNSAVAHVIPGPGGASFVHYSIEIEPQHMSLAKDGNVYYTSFELKGEVTTGDSKVIHGFAKEPYLKLTESEFREVVSRPFSYRDMFPLVEGDYQFRLVMKNRARSEYTIFETPLHVAGPDDVSTAPYLGEPVLLYESALVSGPEADKQYRTYQIGNVKLEPNARRVYAIGQTLTAYVPVGNRPEDGQISLRIVNREGPPNALPSQPNVQVQDAAGGIVGSASLTGLVGGRYRLVVDLLDSSAKILTSQFADFDVTPRSELLRPWALRDSIEGERTGVVDATLAEQYIQKGDMARARALCQRAVVESPNLARPRLILARFHLDEGNAAEAMRLLEPAHAQYKDDVEILLTLADAHFQAKSYQRAVDLFEAAVALRRPTTSLLNALAISHAQLGHRDQAIENLERSLELDPGQETVKKLLETLRSPSEPRGE